MSLTFLAWWSTGDGLIHCPLYVLLELLSRSNVCFLRFREATSERDESHITKGVRNWTFSVWRF